MVLSHYVYSLQSEGVAPTGQGGGAPAARAGHGAPTGGGRHEVGHRGARGCGPRHEGARGCGASRGA